MRVTLNLATRPFADLGPAIKRLRIAMGVLAFLSIHFWVGLHFIHQKAEAARARDHSLDGQIARIAWERQGYTVMMQQPDNARLLAQAGVLNNLIDQKTFSWTLAMEDLETVLPGSVQVTSLDPERLKDGHIVVHLRVVGPHDRSVDLVRNLEHSRRFLLPRIIGENTAETNDQQRPGQRLAPVSASDRFEFDVLADYNPATPEERKAIKKSAPKKEAGGSAAPKPLPLHPVVPMPLAGQTRQPYTGVARPMQAQPQQVQPVNRPPNVPLPPDTRFPMRPRPRPGTPANPDPSAPPNANPNANPGGVPQ